jgi:hypothetical protein
MVDFEHFVKDLGPYAKHYTSAQLKQLHIEVRKLAEVLLEAHRARIKSRMKKGGCPQPFLDDTEKTVHQ